ncbi:MAG: hypothetical protein KC931_10890 [Candidatus Omnitrophica bacterium]|nr:hypothetical protein [Candidatus Omnitrophota bacterium]MCA9414882.1 hypothetical protein [Candidatus Omnitrophota bacterium]MCA9429954.1 hypothetical protein [Candidatus Omnitrophota bacterium]MCA9442058.1 hypothetical protein [Candidatus Omnitrophota bacterium]MCA9447615.1 hypothetical protein [Candidatus Omnitrophota bacterium]
MKNLVPAILAAALCLCAFNSCLAEGSNLHVHSHAHNDYEHEHPLTDALDNRFYSVEADIWLVDGEILVAHNKGDWKGSLKDLYLDPLKKRVEDKGSIHGDGNPFYLWVDIKDGGDELRSTLTNLLNQYSMLTRFTDEEIKEGPVTVVLTGDARAKEGLVKEYADRPFCRDSNGYSPNDPPVDNKWRWYALRWWSYMDWEGNEDISSEEKATLKKIVDDIHEKGRKVRFYATPETQKYWTVALEVGIDHINTDDLERLNEFLEEKSK